VQRARAHEQAALAPSRAFRTGELRCKPAGEGAHFQLAKGREMAIIITRNGRNAERLEPSPFRDEAQLQAYILANPESLPLGELDEDIRLLVVAREFPTESGPIDALGLDAGGQIYIIETKLYKNPDKRLVLAQVLDYGAVLWRRYGDFGEFLSRLEEHAQKRHGMPLRQKLAEYFGVDEENVTGLLDEARQCLADGRLRFVVLMDRMDDRLKDLIVFVNQNSRFDLYGVELEFYRHEDYEILIPRLFGAEVRKAAATGPGRKRWDEASFMEQARTELAPEELEAVQALLTFSKDRCDDMAWGTGARRASFSPKFAHVSPRSVYTVYSDGDLILNFHWLHDSAATEAWAGRLSEQVQEELTRLLDALLTEHDSIS
jgi:hypothetical protein